MSRPLPIWRCQHCERSLGLLRPDGSLRPWDEVRVLVLLPEREAQLRCPVCGQQQRYRVSTVEFAEHAFSLRDPELMVNSA